MPMLTTLGLSEREKRRDIPCARPFHMTSHLVCKQTQEVVIIPISQLRKLRLRD